jgi:hypothetical protein
VWTAVGAGAWSAPRSFDAADSTPGKATLVTPNAEVGPTPVFTWNAVLGTTYYMLRTIDRDGVMSDRWYGPGEAGCPFGASTCSVTPGTALKAGPASWKVLTWNGSGYGPWSDPLEFTVAIADGSALAPTPVSPLASTSTPDATYRWTSRSGAMFYRLSVRNNGGAPRYWWFTPAAAGCAAGGDCLATPVVGLQSGTAQWQVQTWTTIGHSPWSSLISLTVDVPAPLAPAPLAVQLVSPSGSTSASPPFVWNASAGTTLYYIRVYDSSGLRADRWLQPTQVGCAAGSGPCTFNPGVVLNSGAGYWEVLAWNSTGYSPWSQKMAFTVP